MTDKSAAELEREAEAARARVANTAESLRSKMTPGQLIDEMTGMFSGGDSSAALNNLKAQVRDNPLPLTLVGAGLAWLMLGQGSGSSRDSEARYGPRERYGTGEYGSREGWDGDYPTSDADLGDYGSAGRGGGSIDRQGHRRGQFRHGNGERGRRLCQADFCRRHGQHRRERPRASPTGRAVWARRPATRPRTCLSANRWCLPRLA